MNKARFLRLLEKEMKSFPQLEKERLMNYYNETIEDAMEDGMSEEDAIKSLGAMQDIINQINVEHVETSSSPNVGGFESKSIRRFLIIISSPFWLTIVALIATMYLLYLTMILVLITAIFAIIVFVFAACFHVSSIILANFASGILLLGCMLVSIGILPWLYWLTLKSIDFAKFLYGKGMDMGKLYWQKAVA